jgi:hypothetical protein
LIFWYEKEVFSVTGQSDHEGVEKPESQVTHEQFLEVMDEPGESVKLDTARCLGMLNNGGLGRVPFLISSFLGWGFHIGCWLGVGYLFTVNWVYGLLGIPGYVVLFLVKAVVIEHWIAANLTLAKAKNDPDFYRDLRDENLLDVQQPSRE